MAPSQGGSAASANTWSNRFEQGLHPVIERFNASIGFDIALLDQDLDGSIAHARMLGRCGVISEADAAGLIEGLEAIRREAAEGSFCPTVADEDVHFAVERRLIALLGPLGKRLHTGRSRNDQVGTDLRLWLRQQIDAIDQALVRFERALLSQAERHSEVMIPGYTHLQRAQPICLAHHLLAYLEMAERDRSRLADVRRRVNICPLGAAALAGTPVPIDRRSTAAELGFEAIYANSLDAVSDRDFAVEFMAAASLVLVHLSRLSEEVILWASEEFGFVQLSDRCATGSSLMPQKKNPDVPELVRGKSGRVFGHLIGLLTMIKGLPLATVLDCLEAMAILFEEGLEFRPLRLEQAVASDFSNATDVADYLVARGVPFREAYQLVGGLVKSCLAEGILLRQLPLERWQQLHPAFALDIFEAITPRQVVAARCSEGGTGFAQVAAQLSQMRSHLGT
jgi:argininosuccinate lyase